MKEKYYLLKSKIKELITIITTYKRHIGEMNHYSDKSAVLWGVPEYGNLGDQAITYAEVEFIKKWLGVENVFMIPEKRCIEYIYPLKKLSAKKKWHLFLMGGGNMGEMYRYQERIRQMLFKNIKNCPIVSFPQSVDYTYGTKAHYKAQKVYQSNPSVSLYARDGESYEKMKKLFPECKVNLVPDIVTSLEKSGKRDRRNGVLLCFRADREVNVNLKIQKEKITDLLKNEKYEFIDTYKREFVKPYWEQKDQIERFWEKVKSAKLVITDRLHGMIFSMITDTPCIVFDNSTGKILAFYRTWLYDVPGILMYNGNFDEIENFVSSVLKENKTLAAFKNLSKEFAPLEEELKNLRQRI